MGLVISLRIHMMYSDSFFWGGCLYANNLCYDRFCLDLVLQVTSYMVRCDQDSLKHECIFLNVTGMVVCILRNFQIIAAVSTSLFMLFYCFEVFLEEEMMMH